MAIGDSSMGGALNTTGNVAIGYKTLSKQQSQGWNTAVDILVSVIHQKVLIKHILGAYSMEYNRTESTIPAWA